MLYSPTGIRTPDHPARRVVAVVTELRRAPYCLINGIILGSLEEVTFRKQNVSPNFSFLFPLWKRKWAEITQKSLSCYVRRGMECSPGAQQTSLDEVYVAVLGH